MVKQSKELISNHENKIGIIKRNSSLNQVEKYKAALSDIDRIDSHAGR